jgi:hypothetical protein
MIRIFGIDATAGGIYPRLTKVSIELETVVSSRLSKDPSLSG